jgi:membrane protein DedA with SNARE-associated domain
MAELIEKLPQLILTAVDANPMLGYGAIALVMLLENVIPPIPSEVVMPLAGFLIQQGRLQLVPVVLAGLLGTVLGAWFWYGVGRLINEERLEQWLKRHGRWLGLRANDLARSRQWFNRHGVAVVFWGRIIPGVRTLVSLPAGVEMMPQMRFLAWTTAGSLLWILFLTLAGQALGEGYRRVGDQIGALGDVLAPILGFVVGVFIVFVVVRWLIRPK